MLAEENIEEYVPVPEHRRRRPRAEFILRVARRLDEGRRHPGGRSTSSFRRQDTAADGEIVVALVG